MSKLKVIELNKQLSARSEEMIEKLSRAQSDAQFSIGRLKKMEADLINYAREEAEALQQKAAALETRLKEEAAQKAALESAHKRLSADDGAPPAGESTDKPQEAAAQAGLNDKAKQADTPNIQAKPAEKHVEAKPQDEKPARVENAAAQVKPSNNQSAQPRSEANVKTSSEAKPRPREMERTSAADRPRREERPRNDGRTERTAQGPYQRNANTTQGYSHGRAQQPGVRNAQHPQAGARPAPGGASRPGFSKEREDDARKAQQSRAKKPVSVAQPAPADKPKSNFGSRKTPGRDSDRGARKTIKERGYFDDERMGSRKIKGRKEKPSIVIEPVKIERAVITTDMVPIKTLAEKTGKPASEIIKKLFLLGMMCTINSEIDFDTAELVCNDFGITLEQKIEKTAEETMFEEDREDREEELAPRPPVVTIMGHVDHGKTSLLDRIRSTKVTETEAGGITQHIGAYQIDVKGQLITFLDTPGHEAFTSMRARGAQVTDMAVLVVAADDGIMPQTVEAINHAKAANVPIIVAINKIDKPEANSERVMQELTEHELLPEEWGGDTVVAKISASTGEGIDALLEMILLVAEVQELKANPNRKAKGTIIEARLDKGRGPVATVLVQNGTLKISDTIIAGTAYGKVRAMVDDNGIAVKKALPSQPVEVIGFSEVPVAGDIMYAVEQDRLSKQVAEERKDRQKADMIKQISKVSLDDLFSKIADGNLKELNLIIKADVQGSVEALKQSLEKLSNDEVKVKAIHSGVGAIKESDVNFASASNAIIIGFNVRPENNAREAAEHEKVDIRLYRVIYNAIEDIENAMKGMLKPTFEEVVLGHAEVREIFKVSSVGTIAGCHVVDGKIVRNSQVRLLRDNIVVHEGELSSLKRFKDDVKEVLQGFECGMTIESYNDIKLGDVIEAFEMKEVHR